MADEIKKSASPILERRRDMISQCFRCGLCRTSCPSFIELGTEGASPRGRIQFAAAVLRGETTIDRAIEHRMLDCLNCMRCASVCPAGVKTSEIVLDARAELVDKGRLNPVKKLAFSTVMKSPFLLAASAKIGALAKRLVFDGNSVLEASVPRMAGMGDKRFPPVSVAQTLDRWPEIVPAEGKRKMRVGYFVGCATNLIYTAVADATIGVLARNGVEVVIPRGQACCGIPVYTSGDYATARKLADRNLRVFNDLDIDCIVTDCASCSAALKHELKDIVGAGEFNVPVYDLNEFLVDVIEISREFIPVPVTVTYHDPCHLVRGQNISSQPRELLRMIPGVNLVEMADADMCCGGAGTFAYTHHDLSRAVGERKALNIRATGAPWVVTPCPSCTMQIEDILAHGGIAARVVHPVEVLARAYGLEGSRLDIPDADAVATK